jgi:hypothetical protein
VNNRTHEFELCAYSTLVVMSPVSLYIRLVLHIFTTRTRPLQRLLLHSKFLNAYLFALSITVQAERALSRFVTALLSMAKLLQ